MTNAQVHLQGINQLQRRSRFYLTALDWCNATSDLRRDDARIGEAVAGGRTRPH